MFGTVPKSNRKISEAKFDTLPHKYMIVHLLDLTRTLQQTVAVLNYCYGHKLPLVVK